MLQFADFFGGVMKLLFLTTLCAMLFFVSCTKANYPDYAIQRIDVVSDVATEVEDK